MSKIDSSMTKDITEALEGRLAEFVANAVRDINKKAEEQERLDAFGFKVGDRFQVTTDGAYYADVKKGDKGTITELDSSTSTVIATTVMDDGMDWFFRDVDMEPEAIEPAFKVGDKVRYSTDYFMASTNANGTGVITYTDGKARGYRADFGVQQDSPGFQHFTYTEDELELISETEPAFAKGDRVLLGGKPGTITFIYEGECCGVDEVEVTFDDGTYRILGKGFDGVESLDESVKPVKDGSPLEEGEEVVLLEGYMHLTAGAKGKVVNAECYPAPYDRNLLCTIDVDGEAVTVYQFRLGRV